MGEFSRSTLKITIGLLVVVSLTLGGVIVWRFLHHHGSTIGLKPTLPTTTTLAPNASHVLMGNDGKPFPYHMIRLIDHVVPVHYDLDMMTNIDDFEFTGKVTIELNIIEALHFTVLHVKELTYKKPTLKDESGQDIKVIRYVECFEREQLYIEFEQTLELHHTYTLTIEFNGKLTDSLHGYYRSSYVNKNNEKRYLALTQFEPTNARNAFPCYDEPNKKATYTMRMTRAKNMNSTLFNTPRLTSLASEEYDGMITDTFEKTVKMSTYLVAWLVSDFAKITATTPSGKTVNVYAPPHLIGQGKFALKCGVTVLESYEKFFGVAYPLPKQDLVAIPDFSSYAMENWGLIMFKTLALLYDKDVSSSADREDIGGTIAHEMAHQWFGNLVTMNWWNDLWLNEGFASYLSYHGEDAIDKSWKINDRFVSSLTSVLHKDSLLSSHPISVEVNDPKEISSMFDSISYGKGSAVLRMLEYFIGGDVLRAGLKTYLLKYKYQNTVTNDLWDVLTETMNSMVEKDSRIDVKKVMNTWTNQMGYPVVTVTMDTDGKVHASQQRFVLYTGKHETTFKHFENPYGYKWHVPLTVMTDESSTVDNKKIHWMSMTDVDFRVEAGSKWIKANVGTNSYYRVQYSKQNWMALASVLSNNHTQISAPDRAGLIDDAFSLARAGLLDMAIPLELCRYLVNEKEYIVWHIVLRQLAYIREQMQLSEDYEHFTKFYIHLLSKRLQEVDWNSSKDVLLGYMRSDLLTEALHLKHRETVAKARQLFNKQMTSGVRINPNLTPMVYRAGIENGQDAEWQYLWNLYLSSQVASEKKMILKALGKTKNSLRLQMFLKTSLDENLVRRHGTVRIIQSISATVSGRVIVWQFFKKHYAVLYDRYAGGAFYMANIIQAVSSQFNDAYYLDDVRDFFEGRDTGSGMNAVSISLEHIAMNVAWQRNQRIQITKWLKDNM